VVALRDGGDPNGSKPTFTPTEWKAFLGGVRAGEPDPPALTTAPLSLDICRAGLSVR
jgi:hypothetical protein